MRVRIGSRVFRAPEFVKDLPKEQRDQLAAYLTAILGEQKRLSDARTDRERAPLDFFAEMLGGRR